ncbi:MAG TPA: class I SAM-dependent methyltransferase [Mycobacteriales bacterium]|jgi:SAM-dependent methyltransferase|nr:class I SAM-dependent methyltransferase [Mycobacteriales bacterium]
MTSGRQVGSRDPGHMEEFVMAATFDPELYKRTTMEQWQGAAASWYAWGPVLEVWLGESTDRMLDCAHLRPGDDVLDVAAGAGGQSIAAALRVGPKGRVLATDIAPRILEFAEAAARANGLTNVTTRVADGEDLAAEPGRFDAAISRLGLIYFPNRAGSLAGIRQALRPGGRIAVITYSTPERNAFFSTPVNLVRDRAQLPPPAAGQPGPFSLGDDGMLEAELVSAGFTEVTVDAIDAPLRMASAAEYTRFAKDSFGALHQMLSGLEDAARDQAWTDIEAAMSAYDGPDGFVGPCELLVGAGTRP